MPTATTAQHKAAPTHAPRRPFHSKLLQTLSEFGSTILVAALGSLFGSVMLMASKVFVGYLAATGFDHLPSVRSLLGVLGYVFLALALYVSAIVTSNTCSTVIAGRTRVIALQRLIGASGSMLRGQISKTGLLVGGVGAILGVALAVTAGSIVVGILRANGTLPNGTYTIVGPQLAIPAAAVVITTYLAFLAGSRRVLNVRPLEALSAEVEAQKDDLRSSLPRSVFASILVIVGIAVLFIGVVIGGTSVDGIYVTMLGGFASFTGVAVGATLFVPPVLAFVGKIGSSNPAALLAGRNAIRAPGRTSRATIGFVIGTTLVVTFSVALATYRSRIVPGIAIPPEAREQSEQLLATIDLVSTILTGFSAVIAAIGVVNVLALGALQRRREIGLLRAIGFSSRQVSSMIVIEAVQMVATALTLGLFLGTLYGWAGITALFGSQVHGPVVPYLPPATVAVVIGAGLLLAVIASLGPVRRATRVSPTEALSLN